MPRGRPKTKRCTRMVNCVSLVLITMGITGCSSTEPGNPSPTSLGGETSAESSNQSEADALALLKPCDLLNTQDLSKYHVENAGRTDDPAAGVSAWCRWTGRSNDNGSMVLGIAIRPEQGTADLKATKGQLTTGTVNNGRPAAQLSGETGGSCTVALAVSQSSRVDVSVVGTEQPAEACRDASDISNIVEPQLPNYEG
jgi:Protein of unknown function (DUF3558)